MKALTLIRHAKSSWDDVSTSDHERPLNARGERAAPLMGAVLARRGFSPDAILSSTAVRARTTAKIIAGLIGATKIEQRAEIYHASVSALMKVVRDLDEGFSSALLFGHNPGFEDFANRLIPERPIAHLPTCGVILMRLKIDHWGEIDEDCGELIEFLYPKMFGS